MVTFEILNMDIINAADLLLNEQTLIRLCGSK